MLLNAKGFSKLSKEEKINFITQNYFSNAIEAKNTLLKYWNADEHLQNLHDEFIENTITNFYLPYGVAPNFLINNKWYTLPMVIEESSVVAAASKAAKFWSERGGFKTSVIGVEKIGQVHFLFNGSFEKLNSFFNAIQSKFYEDTASITKNMDKRGGGILSIVLKDKTQELPNYYQLHATFNTKDSMGANFINSCLEQFAKTLEKEAFSNEDFSSEEKNIQIIMSILSNYVPNCLVKAEVSCLVNILSDDKNISSDEFAQKFITAINIAQIEPYRAVTHNKGIMNGIDAVVLATGNDFRAIEAGAHAYASKNGTYKSLSYASLENNIFTFGIELPLAVGTVGGLTALHPLVKFSLQLLGNPNAETLMQIIAAAGLAQNFAAVKSLTTTGIQKGHMKMHLMNILNQHHAKKEEKQKVLDYFKDTTLSHSLVVDYLENLRK